MSRSSLSHNELPVTSINLTAVRALYQVDNLRVALEVAVADGWMIGRYGTIDVEGLSVAEVLQLPDEQRDRVYLIRPRR